MGKRKFKLYTHRKNEERKKQQIRVNQRSEKCMPFHSYNLNIFLLSTK